VDGHVRTYDLRKGVVRCDDCGGGSGNGATGGSSPVTSMATTRDELCVVASCLDGTIRLIEVESGQLLNTFHSHHTAGQYGLECAVTADDCYVVTGSENGRLVLYDLVRATCVQSMAGSSSKPTCYVATHPKTEHTSLMVSANYDGNVVVWDHDPNAFSS